MNAGFCKGASFTHKGTVNMPTWKPHWHMSVVLTTALLVVAMTATTSTCPDGCACLHLQEGVQAYCRYKGMTKVPTNFPEDTFEIDFGHNILETITSSTFPLLTNLRRLTLDNCSIKKLQSSAFINLPSLEYLLLSDNNINTIEDQTFTGLNTLKELHLDLNDIEQVPGGVFSGLDLNLLSLRGNDLESLGKDMFHGARVSRLNLDENSFSSITPDCLAQLGGSLKSLHISYNKKPLVLQNEVFSSLDLNELTITSAGVKNTSFLSSVTSGSIDISSNPLQKLDFRDCNNLRLTKEMYLRNLSITSIDEALLSSLSGVLHLDLSDNKISSIGEVFHYTQEIMWLDLSYNHLKSLPRNLGEYLQKLEVLNVENNRLTTIYAESFSGMTSLIKLYLSDNKLQVFSPSMQTVFDKLSNLELAGNPLHCNCEMRWFRVWLENSNMATGADDCFSPINGYIWEFSPFDFVCSMPVFKSVTRNMNIKEGENIFLICSAEADPAPEVEWTSPFGNQVSTLPPSDRTLYKNMAVWELRQIQSNQGGWYQCKASNVEGQTFKYMYINVVTDTNEPIDVNTLTYPTTTMIPTTSTSITTTTTPPSKTTITTATTTIITTTSTSKLPSMITSSTTSPTVRPIVTSSTTSPTLMPIVTSQAVDTSSKPSPSPSMPVTTEPSTVIVTELSSILPPTDNANKRGEETKSLSRNTIIIIIVCIVIAFIIAILTAIIIHIIHGKRCNAYEVTQTSDGSYNNNVNPPVSKL